ncbi:MAG: hypothetical protein SGILL_009027 [Bacillariaceae sp.]
MMMRKQVPPEASSSNNDGADTPIAPNRINAKDVDAMLVKEMNQMSVKDREDAYGEIHGIHASNMSKQDEEKLPQALKQMQCELDRLIQDESSTSEAAAYRQALQQNSRYVVDETLRSKFVRAERYDAAKAAVRMIKWFDMGLNVFGPKALMRPIEWADLSKSAKSIMDEGNGFMLRTRDPVGRIVNASIAGIGNRHPRSDPAQVYFFGMQHISDDVDTQILGTVMVKFIHRDSPKREDGHLEKITSSARRIFLCSPVRMSAFHLCLPDTLLAHALKASLIVAGSFQDRMRIRTHVGSVTECLYALRSFGIPTKYFPSDLKRRARDYQKDRKRATEQLAAKEAILKQRQQEYEEKGQEGPYPFFAPDLILRPRHEDCLFGKGMPNMNHHGNVSMRKMLEQRWDRYDKAKYGEKMDIAWEVIFEIKRGQGRFLKEEASGLYTEVDDESAREKISIAFRDIVRRIKRQKTQRGAVPGRKQQNVEPLAVAPQSGMGVNHLQQLPHHVYPQPSPMQFGNGTLDLTDGSHQHKRRKCGDANTFNYFCGGS